MTTNYKVCILIRIKKTIFVAHWSRSQRFAITIGPGFRSRKVASVQGPNEYFFCIERVESLFSKNKCIDGKPQIIFPNNQIREANKPYRIKNCLKLKADLF